jgi:hypothetical protein
MKKAIKLIPTEIAFGSNQYRYRWLPFDDTATGGKSTSKSEVHQDHLTYSGIIRNINNSAWSCLRSNKIDQDVSTHNCIEIKLKTDGRPYAFEMEYNEGIQALEDESLAKLKEIRDKYIDEDNIGLSQIEIFEREREVQREAYAKELEDLRESEENKAKLLAEFDTQTVKKKNIVEQSQADAVKKAKNEEVQYYLGATAAITDTLARGSIAAKGFAIAESLFNTFLAMTKALETNAGVPIPGYAIAQAIAIGVFGLAQVANIASTDPTTGSGPGVNSGRGQGNVITQGPRFDTVGDSQNVRDSENNPNQNEPVEAYVVSGKVTNQQALDRNRQNNSRFIG